MKFEGGLRALGSVFVGALVCAAWVSAAQADDAVGLCGDAALLDDVVVEVLAADRIAVTQWSPTGDGGYVLERPVYTCPCDGAGTCSVLVLGRRSFDCVSMACDGDCSLHKDGVVVDPSERVMSSGCGAGPSDAQTAAASARAAELAAQNAADGLPPVVYDDDGRAMAPAGFGLGVELVEGVGVVYTVAGGGDGGDGGGDAAERLFEPRVECVCTDEAGGSCTFGGNVCGPSGPGACQVCGVSVKPWWHFW